MTRLQGEEEQGGLGAAASSWAVAVNLLESVLVSFGTEASKAVDHFVTRSKTGAYRLRAVGVRLRKLLGSQGADVID